MYGDRANCDSSAVSIQLGIFQTHTLYISTHLLVLLYSLLYNCVLYISKFLTKLCLLDMLFYYAKYTFITSLRFLFENELSLTITLLQVERPFICRADSVYWGKVGNVVCRVKKFQ